MMFFKRTNLRLFLIMNPNFPCSYHFKILKQKEILSVPKPSEVSRYLHRKDPNSLAEDAESYQVSPRYSLRFTSLCAPLHALPSLQLNQAIPSFPAVALIHGPFHLPLRTLTAVFSVLFSTPSLSPMCPTLLHHSRLHLSHCA